MEAFSAGEFLQGFIVEASEHLTSIARNLLLLEQNNAADEDELLSELFRSFHTLKGLCGMVGLKEGAQISHTLEAVLQGVQKGKIEVNALVIDSLLSGTRTLSTVVETLRNNCQAMPDISIDIKRLDTLLRSAGLKTSAPVRKPEPEVQTEPGDQVDVVGSEQSAAAGDARRPAPGDESAVVLAGLTSYPDLLKSIDAPEKRKIINAARNHQAFAVLMFTPNAERAERGENVDRLRQQIQAVGTLIKATPAMDAGRIRFQFLIASPQPLNEGELIADEIIPVVIQLPSKAPISAPLGPGVMRATAVRVDVERLDELIRFAGELLVQRSRLTETLTRLDGVAPALKRDLNGINQQMGRTLRDLRRSILRARMVPLAEAFNHMPLVIRDLARDSQKEVRLVMSGETTEVDKLLVEKLLDPLIHLVRNAIIHGIETPDERAATGKPAQGVLTLKGTPAGDHILVEVSDDGRGLDLQRIAKKAQDQGLVSPGQPISLQDALDLITRPGFTTQTNPDLAAGRGVGLDVVQRTIRSFGGMLTLQTTPGQGTTFRLRLPMTLVILDVLLVVAGGEWYAVPRDMIERIIEIDPGKITRIESGELLPAQDNGHKSDQKGYAVLYRLAELIHAQRTPENNATANRLFGLVTAIEAAGSAEAPPKATAEASAAAPAEDLPDTWQGRAVLVVDAVREIREVVVHPLVDPLVAQPGFGGATELGDGRVVLILDLPALIGSARHV